MDDIACFGENVGNKLVKKFNKYLMKIIML